MENQTLSEIITSWASHQTEAFTSREILEANDEIDNVTQVSKVMNKLFNDGIIARKKSDGIGFMFISADKAPADFEKKTAVNIGESRPVNHKKQTNKGPKSAAKKPVETVINKTEDTKNTRAREIDASPYDCEQFGAARKGGITIITGTATFTICGAPGSKMSVTISDITI